MKKYGRKYRLYYLIFIFCIISLLFSVNINALKLNEELQVSENYLKELEKVNVKKVVDGDTIIVNGGRILRFIGVDTPEYGESFYAKTATEYTQNRLLGKDIYIECDKEKFDRFGRLLVYVFLKDGEFFNASLLKKGYASLVMISPNTKYFNLLRDMAGEARDEERGMWRDLPIVQWKNAGDYSGKLTIVRGKIIDSYNSGKTVFLNFDKEYWHTFSAVIFADSFFQFDVAPSQYYLNKKVLILGKVREYNGSPEIIVELPEQIKVCR